MAKRFKVGLLRRRNHSESDEQAATGSIAGILATLKAMGCSSLGRQLSLIATCSFFSGLAQAGILVIVGEFAVNSAQGKNHFELYGHSISTLDAVVVCLVLLMVYMGTGVAASTSTSSTFAKALASIRTKMINTFFRTSWRLQSQERIGHLQQLPVARL